MFEDLEMGCFLVKTLRVFSPDGSKLPCSADSGNRSEKKAKRVLLKNKKPEPNGSGFLVTLLNNDYPKATLLKPVTVKPASTDLI